MPAGEAVLVTVTGPVVAVEGTVAFNWVEDTNTTGLAATPLKSTVEVFVKPTP